MELTILNETILAIKYFFNFYYNKMENELTLQLNSES